jgi:hypothetical protein
MSQCGQSSTWMSGSKGRAAGPSGGSSRKNREESWREKRDEPEECGRFLASHVSYAGH